jgi:hypothetical protein
VKTSTVTLPACVQPITRSARADEAIRILAPCGIAPHARAAISG